MSGTCSICMYFEDAPAAIEASLPGLAALSSAHAALRAEDGLCRRHDRTVRASASCGLFAPRASA